MLPVIIFSTLLLIFVKCEDDLEELKSETLYLPESCERKSTSGDVLTMHYTGSLADTGEKFDSSLDRGDPFVFQLGIGSVIKGWDQGLKDICIGEKRRLTIPSHLGYGDAGAGDKIPGGATLIFEVECLNITDGVMPGNVFKEIDTDEDQQLSRPEVYDYLVKRMTPEDMERQGVEPNKMIDEIFNSEDRDKDGFISHDEFSGPKHDEL